MGNYEENPGKWEHKEKQQQLKDGRGEKLSLEAAGLLGLW